MDAVTRLAPVMPWDAGTPAIHGPTVTGASAGKPFHYAVPATGERPLFFCAEGLPAGLRLDGASGRISGTAATAGRSQVLLRASNVHGRAERELEIVIGGGLAQTPPMGWNSWNAWRRWVDDAKIRAAAEHLVSSGLAARGYTYINIDSCWQGVRGGRHNAIQPNGKFPDMGALSRFIHGKGLKFGIYSTPWVIPWGCSAEDARADWGGGELIGCSSGEQDPDYSSAHPGRPGKFVGKDKHEAEDVAQWVEWEVDYLKYDWTPTDPVSLERMGRLVKKAPRDIVMSVCTGARLEHAEAFKQWANMFRGATDTHDSWNNILVTGFHSEDAGFLEDWRPHVGPGHWYDLDMMALGPQFQSADRTVPCRLSPDEQVSHMSYWALYPSPLMLSCDLTAMDDFTLRLFGNEEILAVNQDRLGAPAVRVSEIRTRPLASPRLLRNRRVHARPLADGSLAVGFFNLGELEDEVSVTMEELDMPRRVAVRDLWERKDLGSMEGRISLRVPAHGTRMIRLKPA
jgi:alpha-galactosidase